MNERQVKRARIGQDIDLTGSRLKDGEVDKLFDFVTRIGQYLGQSHTERSSFTGPSSGGKFTRTETDTYTIARDALGIFIDHHHENYDDDGDGVNGVYDERVDGARGIIQLLTSMFGW